MTDLSLHWDSLEFSQKLPQGLRGCIALAITRSASEWKP